MDASSESETSSSADWPIAAIPCRGRHFRGRESWHVVYNGVPTTTYEYRRTVEADAPLVFLGRVEEIKGPHLAIQVAKRTGRRLVLAGNVPNEDMHRAFFRTEI